MPTLLPNEVVQCITAHLSTHCPPSQLQILALVSPSFRLAVQQHLHRHVLLTSSTAASLFLATLDRTPSLAGRARSLTIARGRRTRAVKSGKGRKAVQTEVEDSVTEEDLVKLCARSRSVKVIHLEEPAFNSLRRRQIGCLSDLPLHTLSITGRPESPFNASTVAQLLLTLPHLKHVALRHVHFFPGAFESLGALPTALSTFSLFSSDVVSAKQLYWLLRTTINNETLSSLALDIPANFRPSLLYPVRWAPVRTTKICCTSDQAGAIENLPLHCPSLQHFTFRTSRQLDPQRLLSACKPFDTVTDLVDASDEGCGLSSLDLAAALAFGFEQATSIRRISLIKSKQWEEGSPLLRAACRARGFEMCYRDFLGEGREFEMLRC